MLSRENCSSLAMAADRRSPIPEPLMQANILSLTKYASRPLIFRVLTPGSWRSKASISALRLRSGASAFIAAPLRVESRPGPCPWKLPAPRERAPWRPEASGASLRPVVAREHGALRFLVQLGLESVAVLDRDRFLRRRAGADLVDEALHVGELRRVVAEDVRDQPRPAP